MWQSIYLVLKESLEFIYFAAGIVIAFVAILGLRQLKFAFEQLKTSIKQVEIGMDQVSIGMQQISLLKKDIETRNQRQSVEKSIEFIERYKSKIFPLTAKHMEVMKENKLGYYQHEVLNMKEFPFPGEGDWDDAIKKLKMTKDVVDAFNELELFSSAFISRLADEKLAFQPLGNTFVQFIEKNYDLFCVCRSRAPYINTIQLYIIWKNRIKKKELDLEMKKLEEVRSSIKDVSIKPIGVVEDSDDSDD